MGKISDIQNNIKAKIDEQFNKLKEKRKQADKKRLAARLKDMNDDELEEYIMLQIKKLQKGNKDTKKEAKTAVVAAIQAMGEPEKQLEVTAQISDELTRSDKGQIIKSIDSTAALLDDNGMDIIKGLDKMQKLAIVERIISNQKVKIDKVSIGEIAEAVDKIYCFVNEANDFTLLKYIGTVQDRIAMLYKKGDIPSGTKEQMRHTQLKLVKLAAKKVVCNYKNIGYTMRIREFMKAAFPDDSLQEFVPEEDKRTSKVTRQSLFLDAVEVEGNKIGLKNAKEIIGDLLEKEEERYRKGEMKKIQRDAGKGVIEKIARLQGENDDARS